jgi:hypothetical protein
MTNPISLRNVSEEMQMVTDGLHTYLNKVSGEVVTITDDHLEAVENGYNLDDYADWEKDALKEAQQVIKSKDYVEFPSQFEIHEYDIMQKFCLTVEDPERSDTLLDLIQGSGAFRRFKNAILRYGIEQDWYAYKDQAYKDIAIEWLEDEGIAYTDDTDAVNDGSAA